jgi:hypothetical protein
LKSLNRVKAVLASSVLGGIVGSSMSLAYAGGAIALGWPLAILSGISTFLLTNHAQKPSSNKDETNVIENTDADTPHSDTSSANKSSVKDILEKGDNFASQVSQIPYLIWNIEMSFLRSVGLMTYFVKRPWLLIVLAGILLFALLPAGIVFTISGIFALSRNPAAEQDFRV